jgi:hypothetical protein
MRTHDPIWIKERYTYYRAGCGPTAPNLRPGQPLPHSKVVKTEFCPLSPAGRCSRTMLHSGKTGPHTARQQKEG